MEVTHDKEIALAAPRNRNRKHWHPWPIARKGVQLGKRSMLIVDLFIEIPMATVVAYPVSFAFV